MMQVPPPDVTRVHPSELTPSVAKVLFLSTSHLPPGGLDRDEVDVSYYDTDQGWMMEVPLRATFCDWLLPILRVAEENDCRWVNFTSGGPVLATLDRWVW